MGKITISTVPLRQDHGISMAAALENHCIISVEFSPCFGVVTYNKVNCTPSLLIEVA
jgi:hypothetical protein